jgi:hypothetical protein
VFAGQDPGGIFSGTYDPAVPGRIRWTAAPELDLSGVSSSGLSGRNGHLRVSSFAECNDRLYAAVGQQIYERIDGAEPHWRLVYTNRYPGHSETGLRGLTAIASPSGQGQVLLAAVEGSAARLVRVDPRDGNEATELDLADFLRSAWGVPAGYVIATYNDMAKVRDTGGGEALLIGPRGLRPAERGDSRRSQCRQYRLRPPRSRWLVPGATRARRLRPPPGRCTVRQTCGGDAVDPGLALPARQRRALFCRLRCEQGAGPRQRLDLPLDNRWSDRRGAIVMKSRTDSACAFGASLVMFRPLSGPPHRTSARANALATHVMGAVRN